ncbi:MAG: hypothetical protein U5K84_09490 [Alkalibacterium sp.]|nr:hypothetical protein [Alkalibacterium sp.]
MANKPEKTDEKIHIVSRKFVVRTISVLVTVSLLYMAALYRTSADPIRLIRGFRIIWDMIFDDLLPPDWGYFSTSFQYLVQTLEHRAAFDDLCVDHCIATDVSGF